MTPFAYVRSPSVLDAAPLLDDRSLPYAGGTDLLPRVKLGITEPARLVDLKHAGLSDAIVHNTGDGGADGIELGALATLAAIERSEIVRRHATALAEAAALAATPQIRNRATIGGNLLQRPRCWYYRDPDIDCWLKGGHDCPARDGRNEHHAVFTDDSPCVAVHPSDLAGCLVALDANVDISSGAERRTVAVADLFAAPTEQRRTETRLGPTDIITAVTIPTGTAVRSTYRKAMDRKAWAFALVGVAVVARFGDSGCDDARIVLSGVANTPRRATAAEDALTSGPIDRERIEDAAQLVVDGARPLAENRYKLDLAVALTRDALTSLAF